LATRSCVISSGWSVGLYRWLARGPCERERTDAELTETICEIHTESGGHPVYAGGPSSSCAGAGWAQTSVVADARCWPAQTSPPNMEKTAIAGQQPIDAPDLIGQDFTAAAPNARWCGDITSCAYRRGLGLHRDRDQPCIPARTSLIIKLLAAALLTADPQQVVAIVSPGRDALECAQPTPSRRLVAT
jgi:putative transposase